MGNTYSWVLFPAAITEKSVVVVMFKLGSESTVTSIESVKLQMVSGSLTLTYIMWSSLNENHTESFCTIDKARLSGLKIKLMESGFWNVSATINIESPKHRIESPINDKLPMETWTRVLSMNSQLPLIDFT